MQNIGTRSPATQGLTANERQMRLGYNELDYLFTSHAGFCHEAETFLEKQIGKSMLLSGASERERNQFFNKIYEKIHVLKAKISAS